MCYFLIVHHYTDKQRPAKDGGEIREVRLEIVVPWLNSIFIDINRVHKN